MAATHVALLRGINVGKAKRIAMADLRALLESLGYGDVKTLLNSGNVVFSTKGTKCTTLASRIEQGIVSELGITSRVTVLSAAELAQIVEENPLGKVATDGSRYMITVLTNPADRAKLAPLAEQDWKPEALALGERVAWNWCPNGVLESRVQLALGKALKDGATTRNWNTILQLRALLAG